MPGKRRDRLAIIEEILGVAHKGAKKTRIMYKASLSFAQLNDYLSLLLEKRMLKLLKDKRTYKTTRSGVNLYDAIQGVNNLLYGTYTPITEFSQGPKSYKRE